MLEGLGSVSEGRQGERASPSAVPLQRPETGPMSPGHTDPGQSPKGEKR